jgi:hypothetical protein
MVQAQSDIYFDEIIENLAATLQKRVSRSTISRALASRGYTYKKVSTQLYLMHRITGDSP